MGVSVSQLKRLPGLGGQQNWNFAEELWPTAKHRTGRGLRLSSLPGSHLKRKNIVCVLVCGTYLELRVMMR